jgi:hypothetical protein
MAYSELIKNFAHIRDYMREFFVYGFKSREEYGQKSARSYDNERRRIESWLSDYMAFRQDASGKNLFISVDNRHVPRNPLYQAWKAASFTRNDISLHFLLLDILCVEQAKSIPEILDRIDRDYLPHFADVDPMDESTLRKKLKEYVGLGMITAVKRGKQLVYRLPDDGVSLGAWQDAIAFFAEENPLGVVGSFLADKFTGHMDVFSYKHRYLLFTLDSDVMLTLLSATREHRRVELELFGRHSHRPRRTATLPMKIFISTQGGRQYLAGFNLYTKKPHFYRLDSIRQVKILDIVPDDSAFQECFQTEQGRIWGVATGSGQLEHLEMTLRIDLEDRHIARRLERERRCGTVVQLDETTWRFAADVYSAEELIPWLRTFMGRIVKLSCSNPMVEARFWSDYAMMAEMYAGGGDSDAV